MKYFSERNGYVKPSNIIIIGKLTEEVMNAISSSFTYLVNSLDEVDEKEGTAEPWTDYRDYSSYQLGLSTWTRFLHKRANEYSGVHSNGDEAFQKILFDIHIPWYAKLDLIEYVIAYMKEHFTDYKRTRVRAGFISELNDCFEELHFGYRIVKDLVTNITSPVEVKALEQAIESSDEVVSSHLRQALALYSQRPSPDYRNSIKEAITAVEALFRTRTGEGTFGPAYSKVKQETTIHPMIQGIVQKMYDYTNQDNTGIRHSKVVDDETFLPSSDEAQLFLVMCSSVVNYFNCKFAKVENIK